MEPTPGRESKGDRRRRDGGTMRQRYPLLAAFGAEEIRFLGTDEARGATAEERIRSVWPFLVGSVLEFAASLAPRARANYDPEDVLGELYLTLLEKDAKWEPDRGKYLSFVYRIVAHELHAIRDRASTVHSPRNSASRLRGYEAEIEDHRISEAKLQTYRDLRRVMAEQESLDPDDPSCDDPLDAPEILERREGLGLGRGAVKRGVAALEPDEADMLGRAHGLFGRPEQTVREIAFERGRTAEYVRGVLARARDKFKRRIEGA